MHKHNPLWKTPNFLSAKFKGKLVNETQIIDGECIRLKDITSNYHLIEDIDYEKILNGYKYLNDFTDKIIGVFYKC